jgi:hypothetical protein
VPDFKLIKPQTAIVYKMLKNSNMKHQAKRIKKKHRLSLEILVTPCEPTAEVESVKGDTKEVHAHINLQGNLSPCRLKSTHKQRC